MVLRSKPIWALGGILLIGYILFRWLGGGAIPIPEPPMVTVTKVTQKDTPLMLHASGQVEAYTSVTIKALVDGQIKKVYFKEGNVIKKDDILFLIDPRPYEEKLRQTEANLAKNQAQVEFAKSDVERSEALFKKGFASKQTYEQKKSTLKTLIETVKGDKSAIDQAKLQLDYCSIKAPLTGIAGKFIVDEGSVVKNNDTTLVTINQIDPIYVTFTISEKNLSSLQQELKAGEVKVTVEEDDPAKRSLNGNLTFVDNTIDTKSGTIRLKATFSNDSQSLWPGEFVKVSLPIKVIKKALLVPTIAVQAGPQGNYVYKIDPHFKVTKKLVTVGSEVGDSSIIEKGVIFNDTIITKGQFYVKEGMTVRVSKTERENHK